MILRANCKINIGLDILRRREDGFHDLESVMVCVPMLYDELEVEINAASSAITFRSIGIPIDCDDDDNLCVRAARLMQRRFSTSGVDITLDKRVPFGAGLGGGSSDATTVLLAMNSLFCLSLSEERLIELAAELGSDTPFFVRGGSQLCCGRGEIMQAIDLDLSNYIIALVKPEGINISTREAYSGVRPSIPAIPLSELISEPVAKWQGSVKNDFESHIFASHPTLAEIKEALLESGAIYAAMSGSGSTLFGLFDRGSLVGCEDLRKRLMQRGVEALHIGSL